jgi:hypothetical protein
MNLSVVFAKEAIPFLDHKSFLTSDRIFKHMVVMYSVWSLQIQTPEKMMSTRFRFPMVSQRLQYPSLRLISITGTVSVSFRDDFAMTITVPIHRNR